MDFEQQSLDVKSLVGGEVGGWGEETNRGSPLCAEHSDKASAAL